MPYRCGFCGEEGHNRQTCQQRIESEHPTLFRNGGQSLQPRSLESLFDSAQIELIPLAETVAEPNATCPICMDELGTQPTTQLMCNHSYCTKCIMLNIEHGNLACPMCRNVVMGPSRKTTELQDKVNQQYNELCDQDEKLTFYEGKFASFENIIEHKEKKNNTLNKEINDITHAFGLTEQHELKPFITGLKLEYTKYQDTLREYDASITSPPLYSLIQSLFESKPTIDSTSASIGMKFSSKLAPGTCKDGNGVIISHDCWVKIISGLYRNHMARMIWKSSTQSTPGYYVVRVYRGLGKPKLSQGVYDCSYTEDIKLCMTSGMSGGVSNCIITRFMIQRIPNNVVRFTINGNGVSLPKTIRTQLRQGKLEIVLHRLHTKKTGGVTIADRGLHNNPVLVKDCADNNIPSSLISSIVAVKESASYVVTQNDVLEFVPNVET
jgi:hypothetical protein